MTMLAMLSYDCAKKMPVSFLIFDLNGITDQNVERQRIMRYVMWCTSVYGVAFNIHIKRCKENSFHGCVSIIKCVPSASPDRTSF